MDFEIKKGGHKDLHRIYPMMEFDFLPFELLKETQLHLALVKGAAELLLIKDERGLEAGYAAVFKDSLYGYMLLAYVAVYPIFRGQGVGKRFLELIRGRYEDSFGIFTAVPEGENAERRQRFYAAQEFFKVPCDCSFRGVETELYCLRFRGPEDLSAATPLIVRDIFARTLTENEADKIFRF
ncbi:MAG: hypothetical protein EOM54_08600 [Clostridia bacterium]|nr:hypothetical protein [Clostridia bacterium]